MAAFHPAVREWFSAVFPAPTLPQIMGWPIVARGESTLILAPTGTGKTLAAFLWCINRLMFGGSTPDAERCRVLYVSPIKALAVDVERNLRAPLIGISQAAQRLQIPYHQVSTAIRSGDTPPAERARFARHPADILITTPESLYLLLTSNARETLRSVEVVVIDEIHALVPNKRGSHLALSIERLQHLTGRSLQRIGLSATQRPLEEVARYLGGALISTATTSGKVGKQLLHQPTSKKHEPSSEASAAEAAISEFETGSFVPAYRPVTIVDAAAPKRLDLRVEVPVEDMANLDRLEDLPSGPASQAARR